MDEYTIPEQYWLVTHSGLTNPFQYQIDDTDKLKKSIIDDWDKYYAGKISSNINVKLTGSFLHYVENFDFSIFKAMQPLTLIKQHQLSIHQFGATIAVAVGSR